MSWQPYRRICSSFLLLLWIFTLVHNVKGVPSDSIVMKARCYANCFAQNTPANKTEETCQSSSCVECLIPCGAPFSDEDTCKQSCNNATSCLKSCAFLAHVHNFSSILIGDGSLPPTPGIPAVISRNFTSISLKWDPVQNTSGTAVYLIEITFTGELSRFSPRYLPEVFVSTQATVKFEHPCAYTGRGNSRTEYTDIFFRFKIAVLTGNSSVSYGPQTSQITLTKPDSVTNVSLDSIVYDSASPGDKIKLTFSFIPPKDQKDLISLYGAFFYGIDPSCEHDFLPRTEDSNGAEATISMHIFHKSLKCIHRIEIYSIVGCSLSDPTVFNYTYPGCKNITDFPVSECYKFDPPYAPLEDRMVSNVTLKGPMTAQQDYRFTAVVTWYRPVYPYKTPNMYFVRWIKEGDIFPKGLVSFTNSQTITNLLPETSYILKILPMFPDGKPLTNWTTITLTTPGVDPDQVKVRHLTYGQFSPSPDGGSFSVNISWEKPTFNYSTLESYKVSYHSGSINKTTVELSFASPARQVISGILHGEQVDYWVIPQYKHSDWIQGIAVPGNATAPVPRDDDIRVQNIQFRRFVLDKGTTTFSVNCTWTGPVFNFALRYYDVVYELSGYISGKPSVRIIVNETFFKISGIFPREAVTVKITPIYSNIHITGKVAEERVTAPQPAEELVQVNNLEYGSLVPTANDTFRTTVSWQKPEFAHSDVKFYKYKLLPTNVSQRERRGTPLNTEITTTSTNATIDEISRTDGVEFQVTPVFVVPEVLGADAKISLVWKLETDNQPLGDPLSTGELAVLVVGLFLAVLIVICVGLWCYREKQRQKKAGHVSGKNALMIDHWEIDGNLVTLEEELGEGAFGKVYKGLIKELTTPSRKMSTMPPMKSIRKNTIKQTGGFTVAVKMLHDMADADQRREFLEEIQLMKAVGSHKNIVNMLGCCTVEEPMFLLVEYIPYGDLLHYLRKRRGKVKEYLGDESRGPYRSTYCETYVIDRKAGGISIQATKSDRIYVNSPEAQAGDNGNIQILSFTQSSKTAEETGMQNKGMTKEDEASDEEDESEEETLTPGDLMAFAWQISEGMEYLARKGFVHRDLAARNVLVGEHKIAKVADFGLTRHVYEEKVYHAKRNRKLPLKWMSIEAIFDQTFTTQSDVWAFGVVLWELVTLGGTPYPTINNRELLRLLKGGYRMEKPDICNDEMFSMMTDCWMENPEDRPNFTQIRERLEEMMQVDNPYLDFSVLDESRDYYNVPSFNSLNEESADDELFDKESDELLKDEGDDISVGEEKPTEDSNKNEIAPLPKPTKSPAMDGDIDSVGVNKIEFHNSTFRGDDFRDLKDVKVNIDSLEMALYRPGSRGIVL